jgi:glucokinase
MGLAIGVDIGGTKVAAGVGDPDGRILARLATRHPGPRIPRRLPVVVENDIMPEDGCAGAATSAAGSSTLSRWPEVLSVTGVRGGRRGTAR